MELIKSIIIFFLLSIAISCSIKEKTYIAEFGDDLTEKQWNIEELNPELPSDWSSFEFLSFDMKATSAQRFNLRIYDEEGERRIRVHPFEDNWVRSSIPLSRFKKMVTLGFTMSWTYQMGLDGCWIRSQDGPFGPITNVKSIGLGMDLPIGSPSIEIRNVKLTMTPEDTVYTSMPLVDEFGQWIPTTWPGKAKNVEELQTAWGQEEKNLDEDETAYSKFRGFEEGKVEGSGFFRVEKIDEKWWFVDPEGHLFLSTGSCSVRPGAGYARVEGREYLYTALPPEEVATYSEITQSYWNTSFYTWNLLRRFGENWYKKWMDLTVRRMDNWGLNTLASWSDNTLMESKRRPYTAYIYGLRTDPVTMGLPDVYVPGYTEKIDSIVSAECSHRKDDPYLIGYFIGNEPIWPDRESDLVDVILKGDDTPMQSELKKFLSDGDTPEKRKTFVYDTYTRYIKIVNEAIKKNDPNHLNMGLRFGGSAPTEIISASKDYFDVFSINMYKYVAEHKQLQRIYDLAELPIIIGEFHFGTIGRGLAAGLAQTKNQEERAAAYQYYVENAMAHPAVIGAHWFKWMDQPPTGRNDGENYNIGFVDVTDQPYQPMVKAARETFSRLQNIHKGNLPPTNRQTLKK